MFWRNRQDYNVSAGQEDCKKSSATPDHRPPVYHQAQLVKTAPNFSQKSALLLVVAIQPLTHEDCHVLSESREC